MTGVAKLKFIFHICIRYIVTLQVIMNWRRIIVPFVALSMLLFAWTEARADDGASVYFRINVSEIESSWEDNASALVAIDGILSDTSRRLKGVNVRASASPDGPSELNARLALERARNIIGRLGAVRPEIIADSILTTTLVEEDWDGLKDMLERSTEPWKDEAIAIIEHNSSERAEAQLRVMHGGKVWEILAKDYLPYLRRADVTFIFESIESDGSSTADASSESGTSSVTPPLPQDSDGSLPGSPVASTEVDPVSEPASKSSLPMWSMFVMGALAALLVVFAAMFFRERKKNSGQVPPPVAPTPSPKPSTPPAPAPSPEPVKEVVPPVVTPSVSETSIASSAPIVPVEPSEFLLSVKVKIQENISNPAFGVEELAAAMGMSRIHLNRKLKADSETSPSTLLKEARMKFAADALLAGEMSIAEIASKSGFSTPSYFSTAFKDWYGMTPSEYISKN